MKRILYTRHDGGVSVCAPSARCLRVMACGGLWADRPRGYVDIQIERQIAAGHHADAAAKFARAVAFGGVTEREAYEIIRDRDCGHLGTAHDLIDFDELPDRWFRDAWYRSANGGPVSISLEKARPIQWARIRSAVKAENEKRAESFESRPELRVDWDVLRTSIKRAGDVDDLRRVWIGGLDGRL